MERNPHGGGFDRRALLRRAAAAGVLGWTTPVILSSETASAGVFTSKCAPGTITATASYVLVSCLPTTSIITITISFSGPCPCGGTKLWCAQKNSPAPTVSGTSSTLSFSVTIPIFSTITISGKVALGCTDRDGDTQYAVYNWTMTASDNGGPCGTIINSISGVTLSNRTIVSGSGCPSLASLAPAPAVIRTQPAGTPRRSAI